MKTHYYRKPAQLLVDLLICGGKSYNTAKRREFQLEKARGGDVSMSPQANRTKQEEAKSLAKIGIVLLMVCLAIIAVCLVLNVFILSDFGLFVGMAIGMVVGFAGLMFMLGACAEAGVGSGVH